MTKPKLSLVPRTMSVQSVYYRGREVVKTNRSYHAENAAVNCHKHMRSNRYAATHAEVFDERDGVLHAVIKRTVEGNVHILYKREYKEGR